MTPRRHHRGSCGGDDVENQLIAGESSPSFVKRNSVRSGNLRGGSTVESFTGEDSTPMMESWSAVVLYLTPAPSHHGGAEIAMAGELERVETGEGRLGTGREEPPIG